MKKSRVKDDESRTTSESPMVFKKISERFITQCVEGGSTPGSLWLDTGLIITDRDSKDLNPKLKCFLNVFKPSLHNESIQRLLLVLVIVVHPSASWVLFIDSVANDLKAVHNRFLALI